MDPTGANLSDCDSRPDLLESIVSVCYPASMLRDELRPVNFRMIVCKPACFDATESKPPGFHILKFDQPREFSAFELRALSQAAGFYRSLIGVSINDTGVPQIWGIVHTGPRWLKEMYGGKKASTPLPPTLVVCVNGPGFIEVCRGSVLVGQLRDGIVFDESMNIFESKWLPGLFTQERESLLCAYQEDRARRNLAVKKIDPAFLKQIGQRFVKRLIAAVQASHHGGTLILVPEDIKEELLLANPYLNVKYRFESSESRTRYRSVLLSMMNLLVDQHHSVDEIGWHHYEDTTDDELNLLDEALFEMSYLVAGLTSVDGAVLMTKRFETLGFGAEITCNGIEVPRVARALDIEGENTLIESADGFGTRHRSAFRLAQSLPGSFTVVISQDGDVRAIRNKGGMVTSWNHRPSLQITP